MTSHGLDLIPTGASASQRTLRKGITFFSGTCVLATCGYVLAGWSWIDSIYMVIITIFGVGYGEVHPIDQPWLKYFTMAVIFAGCSSLIFVIGGIVQLITEGEIARIMGTRTREKEIQQLNDHVIVCGYGRVGQMLAIELSQQGHPMMILDRDPARVDQAIDHGYLAMVGDAADDHTLSTAGIFRAKTLATVLPDDATNVFITLSARDLCEHINIIARAECPTTERKLLRGGASSVVMPAAIGAIRIAQLATSANHAKESLPENRYRILEANDKSDVCPVLGTGEHLVAAEVERLAELAHETVRQEDDHQLEEIAKENA